MWEYKTILVKPKIGFSGKFNKEDLDYELNESGNKGWELVSTATSSSLGDSSRLILFLKRKI